MNKRFFLALILILISFVTIEATDLNFSDKEWDFGTITSRDKTLVKEFVVLNTGKNELKVTITPTCDCLTVSPASAGVVPGGSAFFRFFYNPHEDSGEVERFLMLNADEAGFETIQFKVSGYVDVGVTASEPTATTPPQTTAKMKYDLAILYYYMPTCPTCRKFIATGFPALVKKLNRSINLVKREIDKPENLKECAARLKKLGLEQKAFPVLIIGDRVFQGNEEIDRVIEAEIAYALEHKITTDTDEPVDTSDVELKRNLTFLPVIAAGLIDGINPCAFATIIMLLSSLALAGKRRKEILMMGIFFTVSVFITYYAVGVGMFTAFQAANSFPIVALIIKWVLFGVLVLFSALSVYDYFKIRAGKADEMILQLPDLLKRKIKDSIRVQVRSAALVASSLLLGFLVSIFELGCTGQVYFPTIMTMVRVGKEFWGFIFLAVYCLGFIAPLVVVFIFTYKGISSQTVLKFFQEKMGLVKLILAALFLGLAILTLVI